MHYWAKQWIVVCYLPSFYLDLSVLKRCVNGFDSFYGLLRYESETNFEQFFHKIYVLCWTLRNQAFGFGSSVQNNYFLPYLPNSTGRSQNFKNKYVFFFWKFEYSHKSEKSSHCTLLIVLYKLSFWSLEQWVCLLLQITHFFLILKTNPMTFF